MSASSKEPIKKTPAVKSAKITKSDPHLSPYVAPLENQNLKALREGFGEGMMALGESTPEVVALCADLAESDHLLGFKEKYPLRFVEIGVAEQNLVGVGAGMAHVGKVPFVASFAVFCPGRTWDQIRVSGCYSNQNLKIYGGHAGITVGEDGATHQALEDVAILRAIPRMTVIVPADAVEMKKATLAAAQHPGVVYLRGGRPKLPQVNKEDSPFIIGKANVLRTGEDVAIIACGIMVREALLAAEILATQGVQAKVINMHTIKPLDEALVIASALECRAIVTVEEHQIIGGLGSAVSEVLAEHAPTPIERVGVRDIFGESGTWSALLDKYGLRAEHIVEAAKRAGIRKREQMEQSGKLRVQPSMMKKILSVKKRTPARPNAKKKLARKKKR